MSITSFLQKLKQTPKTITFPETIAVIEENYDFTPTAFDNGTQHNAAGENSGSCKLFAFAKSIPALLIPYPSLYLCGI